MPFVYLMLFFANKQSLLLRTSTRSPTCKTTHRTPVWSIERSQTILVICKVFWEVNHLKTTLKLSWNLSKKWIYPCSFLEFCNFAWIMWFLTNYAKSCDLRSIIRNRNIAEYQKPCRMSDLRIKQLRLLRSMDYGQRSLWPHIIEDKKITCKKNMDFPYSRFSKTII